MKYLAKSGLILFWYMPFLMFWIAYFLLLGITKWERIFNENIFNLIYVSIPFILLLLIIYFKVKQTPPKNRLSTGLFLFLLFCTPIPVSKQMCCDIPKFGFNQYGIAIYSLLFKSKCLCEGEVGYIGNEFVGLKIILNPVYFTQKIQLIFQIITPIVFFVIYRFVNKDKINSSNKIEL